MYPILISIGSFHIYSFSIALVIAWIVFSFIFWRHLRAQAIQEDVIFDLTFYATFVSIFFARFAFIFSHWDTFVGKSPLLMVALWVAPGLSWFGGLIGGLVTLIVLSRRQKVRLGVVLDMLPVALIGSIIIGKFGSLLDGSEVGKRAVSIPWGVYFVGQSGARHPVQLYEIVCLIIIGIVMVWLAKCASVHKWAYGILGIVFIMIYSMGMFVLEFLKDSRVYWGNITANQWVMIGLFAESVGVLYVRGGGREYIRPYVLSFHKSLGQIGKNIYAKLSRRYSSRDQKSS